MKRAILYIVIILLFPAIIYGQEMNRYHIDIYNGLPSNHVYSTLVDHHGYLWICTDKGVVRYNGYEFKKFGLAEGLPNEDVWQMIEDSIGRVWLLSIADGIGYVYNNKYHSAIFSSPVKSIRPSNLTPYSKGIVFLTPYAASSPQGLCIEHNDTIDTYDMFKYVFWGSMDIDDHCNVISVLDNNIYSIDIRAKKFTRKLLCGLNDTLNISIALNRSIFYGHNIIIYKRRDNGIWFLNMNDCSHNKLMFKDLKNQNDHVNMMEKNKGNLYVIGESCTYKLNRELKCVEIIDFSSITGTELYNGDVSYVEDDNIWGKCLSTYKDGIFVARSHRQTFKKFSETDLSSFSQVGYSNNESYWWNKSRREIVIISGDNKTEKFRASEISDINKIVSAGEERLIMSPDPSGDHLYLFNGRRIKKLMPKMLCVQGNHFNSTRTPAPITSASFSAWKDAIAESPTDIYAILTTNGIAHTYIARDTTFFINIDKDFYKKITYDSSTKYFWGYNNHKILLFDRENHQHVISKAQLNEFGVHNIESIQIDQKFDNIFIEDYNKLLVFNRRDNSFQQLFKNYNLDGATVCLKNGTLIVIGKFGILFSKITGAAKFSAAIVFPNNKNEYYNIINEYSVSGNEILLKTDKGTYTAQIPQFDKLDSTFARAVVYNVLVSYGKEVYDIGQNDTLLIDQKDTRLLFDVINPNGNGAIHYSYRLENQAWSDLNSNELALPRLKADQYYMLSINAYDDAWRSDNKHIYIYLIPYWWQTTWGTRSLWTGGVIMLVLLGGTIAVVTRKIVSKNNERKNLQLGLELNAVYSQINPHFVFNTLNTAQYFIKKKKTDEAFIHINKFSRLLRSYIKASRNKFISIEEEAINLRNYVELQQERFEDRFDYQIVIDEGVDTKIRIPSLLLQPIVENAINHGLFHKETKGNLLIRIGYGRSKNEIICIIDDDGIGRKRSKQLNDESTIKRESYGDQLIKDLINVFNKYEKVSIEMEYFDKEAPLTGTTVKLAIKNFKNE